MPIWIAYSYSEKVCIGCNEPIPVSKPMLIHKDMYARIYYHPICWVEGEISKLQPFNPQKGGKPPLHLTSKQKDERIKILRNMATYRKRIKEYQGRDEVDLELNIMRMKIDLELLSRALVPLGGLPGTWRVHTVQ